MLEVQKLDAYSTKNKCEYTGRYYKDRCSCKGHRRDRQEAEEEERHLPFIFVDDVKPLKRSNSYELLGIEPPICIDTLKTSYRRKALQCHPDKTGGSGELFIKVKEAYDELLVMIC